MPANALAAAPLVPAVKVLLAVMLGGATLPAHAAATPPPLGQRAVALAAAQHGKPYRFGAAGPHAFDCSGFVAYVYGRLGHRLPHNADAQYWRTRHISPRALRPGDLVFMKLSSRVIDHVGIYAGHGTWWVARRPGTTITRQHIWTRRIWAARVG